jgi:hypothetical protein
MVLLDHGPCHVVAEVEGVFNAHQSRGAVGVHAHTWDGTAAAHAHRLFRIVKVSLASERKRRRKKVNLTTHEKPHEPQHFALTEEIKEVD